MTVTVYKSTDASAPTLSGTAGDLTTLLDAILVNGYGSKAAQGWAIEFTGTNKRAYRPASGTRFRLRVDDSGGGAANYARVVGYESMSDVDTGTNAFPTAAQFSGGLYLNKSSAVSATARAWYAIGNGTHFYLVVNIDGGANGGNATLFAFGDFTSFAPADAYNCHIIANTGTTIVSGTARGCYARPCQNGAATGGIAGHYMARASNGVGGSISYDKYASSFFAGFQSNRNDLYLNSIGSNKDSNGTAQTSITTAKTFDYPNPVDGAALLGRVYVGDGYGLAGLRGYLPGLYCFAIGTGAQPGHYDTMSGAGAISTKTFDFVGWSDATIGAGLGRLVFESSSTW